MQVSSFSILKYFYKNLRLLLRDFKENFNLDLKTKLIHFDKNFQKKSWGKFLTYLFKTGNTFFPMTFLTFLFLFLHSLPISRIHGRNRMYDS